MVAVDVLSDIAQLYRDFGSIYQEAWIKIKRNHHQFYASVLTTLPYYFPYQDSSTRYQIYAVQLFVDQPKDVAL